jgi:hypothetical protein
MAVRYLENAASHSSSARTKYHLAMAYFGVGKKAIGQKTLALAQAIDPYLPEADMAHRVAQSAP